MLIALIVLQLTAASALDWLCHALARWLPVPSSVQTLDSKRLQIQLFAQLAIARDLRDKEAAPYITDLTLNFSFWRYGETIRVLGRGSALCVGRPSVKRELRARAFSWSPRGSPGCAESANL